MVEADGAQADSNTASGQTTDVEGMLMMAVGKLYKEDHELDVQMGLLRVILQVLQRHGTASADIQRPVFAISMDLHAPNMVL